LVTFYVQMLMASGASVTSGTKLVARVGSWLLDMRTALALTAATTFPFSTAVKIVLPGGATLWRHGLRAA
jgi:hypothetical protein